MEVRWWIGRLIIELWICLMVQFMKLWSITFKSLSLPWDIRLVTPCRVIGITVRLIPRPRELCSYAHKNNEKIVLQ
jgi:hypothetical protein